MKALFEIEWCGGAAEKHFRRVRPFARDLPWGTIDKSGHAPEVLDRARAAWSSIAIAEYRAAAAFSDVLAAVLAARAPLDIVGMAGDFVADEVMHVELASRLAMELGGGAPIEVDFETMGVLPTSESLNAFERANDLVLRIGCIAETISGAVAVGTRAVVEQPLIHAIVEQIARDEARHMRFGWLYLEWAVEDMSDDERTRLGSVAAAELTRIAPVWRRRGPAPHGREFGWLDGDAFRGQMSRTVRQDIIAPLEKLGVTVDRKIVEDLV